MTVDKCELQVPEKRPAVGQASPWGGTEFETWMVVGWGLGVCDAEYGATEDGRASLIGLDGWLLHGQERAPAGWLRADLISGVVDLHWLEDAGSEQFGSAAQGVKGDAGDAESMLLKLVLRSAIASIHGMESVVQPAAQAFVRSLQQAEQ